MRTIKRTIIFLLIVLPVTIYLCKELQQCDETNMYRVDGIVSEAYVVKRHNSYSRIVMEDGNSYSATKGFARKFLDCSDISELNGRNISFMVEGKKGFFSTPTIVAWNTSEMVFEESLKWSNTNRLIVKTIGIVFVWILASPLIVTEIWIIFEKHNSKNDMLKRRKQKHAKRQRQAEKYSSLETSTEMRHIQNKNMSKKKQKQRMKQNKPSNKN